MKLLPGIILLLFLMSVTVTAVEIRQEENTPQILLIHSNSTEQISIGLIFQEINIPVKIENRLISNLTNTDFQTYDMIVFVSSNEFDLNENDENRIKTFLSDPSKYFILFSPFIDELEDSLETLLGIDNVGDRFPEVNVTNWELRMDQNMGDLSTGETFQYTGQYSLLEALPNTNTIASVIGVNSEGESEAEISFPQPAIINATSNKAHIITSTLSPYSSNPIPAISLNQVPLIFDVLIKQILLSSILILDQSINLPNTMSSLSNTPGEESTDGIIPSLPNFQFGNLFVYTIIIFITLFISKILGILDWIGRKIIGLGILVVGAFYSVEDRILDQKDVYLNQSRADIMDFLDTVGKYGSHLREIKSTTNLGSGSLLWHLKVLEDFNWISKYKIDNFSVYVSYNYETTFDPYVKSLELKLQSKYSFDLIDALLSINFVENIVISDLQDLTGIPNKAIRRFVNKLAELDLVKIRSHKPIQFRIYNHSILNNLLESFKLRTNYEISETTVNVEEIE